MTATDELRRLLDERGVEWRAPTGTLLTDKGRSFVAREVGGGLGDRWIRLPIGADGEPIRMGDTVRCGDGEPFVVRVRKIRFREGREALVGDGSGCWYFRASSCSHAAPDSWEAIEAEARERLDDGLHPNDEWVLDLLYRVRGLYGEEG